MKPIDVIIVVLFSVWPIIIAQWPNFVLFQYLLIKSGFFLGIIYFIDYSYKIKRPLFIWKKSLDKEKLSEKILLTGSPIPKTRKSALKLLVKIKDKIWPEVITDCLSEWSSGTVADGIIEVIIDIFKIYNITEKEIDYFLDIFYSKTISSKKLIELLIYLIESENIETNIKQKTMNIVDTYFKDWSKKDKMQVVIKTLKAKNIFIVVKTLKLIEENNLFQEQGIIKALEDKKEAIKSSSEADWKNIMAKIDSLLESKSYPYEAKHITLEYLKPALMGS